MGTVLEAIQQKWSSENPRDRTVGWIGKIAYEGGLSLFFAAVLASLVFGGVSLASVGIGAEPAAVGVLGASSLTFFNKTFCNLIQEV